MTATNATGQNHHYARVTGVRRDLFVEFDFIVGDPTLSVELILPFPAFQEFCSVNDVELLATDDDAIAAYAQLCARYGAAPGP